MGTGSAIAAVDCGTNSTRLLVSDGTGRPIDRLMRITRLGQGVDATGRLAPEAVQRCLDALAEFRTVMDRHGVTRGRLVATSAVRDAANGPEFLTASASVSGLRPELLSGLDEGRLSMVGAVGDLDRADGPFLVLDIGGGSTELVAGRSPDDPELAAVSLQLGCVRLTERFLQDDPPSDAQLAAAGGEIAHLLDETVAAHPGFREARRLVGLAGTVSTVSALQQRLADYDRARIHHAVLLAGEVRSWYLRLAAETAVERLVHPGMVEGRQDVIVGGAMILDAVMHRLGFADCLVSESDILDGLIAVQVAA